MLELDFFQLEGRFIVSAEGARQASAETSLMPDDVLHLTAFGDQFRRGHIEEELTAVKIGRFIFDRVFRDGIGTLFHEARATARERRVPLRIALRFPPASEILEVPWELLHDGSRFLALDPWTPVVRNLRLPDPEVDLAVEPPLRVLLTTAGPDCADPNGATFVQQVEDVRTALLEAGERVQIEVAEGGSSGRPLTLQRLEGLFQRARTRRLPYHVWHHIGHGGLRLGTAGTEFYLLLETAAGAVDPVPAARLTSTLAGRDVLKLAVLCLCFSSSTVGLGTELARLNVPAVLGFCSAVIHPAALQFARALYQGIPMGAIDDSVTEARHAMADRRWPLEWALPVLLCRSRGNLELLANRRRLELETDSTIASRVSAVSRSERAQLRFGGGPITAKRVTQIGTVGKPRAVGRQLEVDFSPQRIEADDVLQIAEITAPLVANEDFLKHFHRLQERLAFDSKEKP